MISTGWLNQRAPYWRRLDALLTRAERSGVRALSHEELQDLGMLYRQAAADLATLREEPSSRRFAAHVNQLLGRAHHALYASGSTAGTTLWSFLRRGFPEAIRRHTPHIVAAIAVFLVGALIGTAVTWTTPGFAAQVIGPEMVATIDRREMWTASIVSVKPVASSAIMTNNLSVAFMAFAMGVTAGIGTVYMLAFNGLMIGVIGLTCWQAGMSLSLWSFVAPHGVLELPAIFFAGAAGLRLAEGLLFPGLLPRRESLSLAGRDAVRLIAGCVPMLIIAGIIEAFVSPTDLAVAAKFAMAAALFTLFVAYVWAPGRATS